MENIQVIENLKSLLVEYTSNTETQIANNLTMIFQSFQNKSLKEDIDNYAEFVLLGASLFELKAKRLLPQDEEVDWLDEVELIKDKDLAFARLLQFKAFTEVGLAMAIKVKQTEREELPDLQIAIDDLLKLVDKRLNTTFEELVSSVNSSQEAVAFFLALLEAVRWGFIKAEQTNVNKEIIIEKNYE